MITGLSLLATLLLAFPLDAAVRPRTSLGAGRSGWGGALLLGATAAPFGLFLLVSGDAPLAAALTLAVLMLIAVASNAKRAMLGEPLVFSDFALLAALVRHPVFYTAALSRWQKLGIVAGSAGLLAAFLRLSSMRPAPRLAGAAMLIAALAIITAILRAGIGAGLAPVPDADGDVTRHGLIPTLLLHWRRWRTTSDPPALPSLPAAPAADHPEIVVVIQCESFADPVALTGDAALALPGLSSARARAFRWGDLAVSGFGAYTMRTEYGVLFGRSEAALGFRRYDPFLTAQREASYALPARLGAAGYLSVFAHPHSLRFYRRDRLMPAIGFSRVIGPEGFPAAPAGSRYLGDRTFGAGLCALADAAAAPTFIYAVTMENHGPWSAGSPPGSPGGLPAYLSQLRESDAMLADLIEHLDRSGRRALLVFFGDHRPSIPGVTRPDAARHTPYVMLRFPAAGEGSDARVDLTPDELNHQILTAALASG